jgi:hypothetical protein
VRTANHHSYGTAFIPQSPVTVSARRVALSTPLAPVCGVWTLNLEVTGFDTTDSGDGPFALILANSDSDQGCFDISNAIVGNQIPTPGHGVRRGLQRQTRAEASCTSLIGLSAGTGFPFRSFYNQCVPAWATLPASVTPTFSISPAGHTPGLNIAVISRLAFTPSRNVFFALSLTLYEQLAFGFNFLMVLQLPPVTAKSFASAPVICVESLDKLTGALLLIVRVCVRECPTVVAGKARVPAGLAVRYKKLGVHLGVGEPLGVGVGVGVVVGVGVEVAVAVIVAVAVEVAVAVVVPVAVAVGVRLGVDDAVDVAVGVAVLVAVEVWLAVAVTVAVDVAVGEAVAVEVGDVVGPGVGDAVGVALPVAVAVALADAVGVGVGVADGEPPSIPNVTVNASG